MGRLRVKGPQQETKGSYGAGGGVTRGRDGRHCFFKPALHLQLLASRRRQQPSTHRICHSFPRLSQSVEFEVHVSSTLRKRIACSLR
jgi:hypothetical protein